MKGRKEGNDNFKSWKGGLFSYSVSCEESKMKVDGNNTAFWAMTLCPC